MASRCERHKIVDYYRQRSVLSGLESLAGTADIAAASSLTRVEDRSAINGVLSQLPPRQATALILHASFGVPFAQIGWALGVSEGAARLLAWRATLRLRG